MPDTESKGDSLMFRETLTELERLVDVRVNSNLFYGSAGTAIDEGVVYMLKLLTELDVNTSELNAINELEHLADLISKRHPVEGCPYIKDSCGGSILDKMIDSKLKFIKNGAFSIVGSEGGIEPMAALERLAAVESRAYSQYMDGLLEAKIREIVWRPRAKAGSRHDHVFRRNCY